MLALIVAKDEQGVIGINGHLPWHLPDDLAYFKAQTLNKTVVMGRKTFESIGRPLPKRNNIILTRQENYQVDGAQVIHSVEALLALILKMPEVMVIGGEGLYRDTLPLAERLYITEVKTKVQKGDAFFPSINNDAWTEVSRTAHPADVRHFVPFDFVVLEKKVRGAGFS